MKIIEGLKPYEVMRLHEEEGKRVAYYDPKCGLWKVLVQNEETPIYIAMRIAEGLTVAIIDDSQPEIDWSGFDWEFFNQYDGVRCYYGPSIVINFLKRTPDNQEDLTLVESPFYPWFGGKCPVPGNVEVETVYREKGDKETNKASHFIWTHAGEVFQDIIAFRLTGKVL